ncbi:hypothetical protein Bca4012_029072 [Brassica carinata]
MSLSLSFVSFSRKIISLLFLLPPRKLDLSIFFIENLSIYYAVDSLSILKSIATRFAVYFTAVSMKLRRQKELLQSNQLQDKARIDERMKVKRRDKYEHPFSVEK